MANGKKTKPSFSTSRKWSIGFNVVVASLAVFALVVMVNYLAVRHYLRFQLAERAQIKLSAQTTSLLQSLTNQVKVTVFFDAQGEDEIYSLVSSLLKEYHYINPDLVVKTVDPTRDPGRAQLLLAEYKLTNLKDRNFVLFDCGGHVRIVNQNELSDYDVQSVIAGKSKEFRRIGFKGEMLFTSAILSVAYPRPFRAYFLKGHGEHDPEVIGQPHGYAKFASILKDQNNIQWERFALQGTNDVPADCQLLIIAGPQIPFTDFELEKVERYLQQGGRLLALLNNMALGTNSGVEKILAKWGVHVADNIVFDKFAPTPYDLLTARLSDQHPVVKPLVSEELQIRLVLPRAVGVLKNTAPNVDAPKVDVLAATSEEATEATDIRDGVPYRNPYQKPKPFPLIVSVEQGGIKDVTADLGTTRLVVVGDSLCMDNEIIDTVPGNHYFASQAVNWLLGRDRLFVVEIGPRPLKDYKLIMTESQRQNVKWLLLAGMPGAVLLLGSLVWLRRRR